MIETPYTNGAINDAQNICRATLDNYKKTSLSCLVIQEQDTKNEDFLDTGISYFFYVPSNTEQPIIKPYVLATTQRQTLKLLLDKGLFDYDKSFYMNEEEKKLNPPLFEEDNLKPRLKYTLFGDQKDYYLVSIKNEFDWVGNANIKEYFRINFLTPNYEEIAIFLDLPISSDSIVASCESLHLKENGALYDGRKEVSQLSTIKGNNGEYQLIKALMEIQKGTKMQVSADEIKQRIDQAISLKDAMYNINKNHLKNSQYKIKSSGSYAGFIITKEN